MLAIKDSIQNFVKNLNFDGGYGYLKNNNNGNEKGVSIEIKTFMPLPTKDPRATLSKMEFEEQFQLLLNAIQNPNFRPSGDIDYLYKVYLINKAMNTPMGYVEFMDKFLMDTSPNFSFIPPEAIYGNDSTAIVSLKHFTDSLLLTFPNLFLTEVELYGMYISYIKRCGYDPIRDKAYLDSLKYQYNPQIWEDLNNRFQLSKTREVVNPKILFGDIVKYLIAPNGLNYPLQLGNAIAQTAIENTLPNRLAAIRNIDMGFSNNQPVTDIKLINTAPIDTLLELIGLGINNNQGYISSPNSIL